MGELDSFLAQYPEIEEPLGRQLQAFDAGGPALDVRVALTLPTETPAAGLLDTGILVDRAFRWAARSVERAQSVKTMARVGARPIPPRAGLIIRQVEGRRSAALYFELSERIYHDFLTNPIPFLLGVVTALELFGIHVRVRIFRDAPAITDSEEPQGPDSADPDQVSSPAPHISEHDFVPPIANTTIVNYAPTIIINVDSSTLTVETDEDQAHAIEERERRNVERQLERREALREVHDARRRNPYREG